MKKLLFIPLLTGALFTFTYAASYPVQPANNGIAKKSLNYIFTDTGLAQHTTLQARIEAAKSANALSKLIVDSIKKLGIANDGFITDKEVKQLNTYMYDHYHNLVVKYHGDDERKRINGKKVKIETGLHKVVNNGGVMKWKIPVKKTYKKANRAMDGVFHLGLYPTVNQKRILNEDGNKNVRWRLISRTLYVMLKNDFNLKSWAKKAYYKPQIKKLIQEKKQKVTQLKASNASKAQIRELVKQYNQKIQELRKLMK